MTASIFLAAFLGCLLALVVYTQASRLYSHWMYNHRVEHLIAVSGQAKIGVQCIYCGDVSHAEIDAKLRDRNDPTAELAESRSKFMAQGWTPVGRFGLRCPKCSAEPASQSEPQ